ncbi:hypothetical protein DFH06DRAFT_309743 [Mycena polygramma]|nr:hypothetical protein DFH06DRAFT_309743 [Mycena polygramma]
MNSSIMFNTKSLLFFITSATLLSNAVGQSWEVMVWESSAGGTSSCTGGGTTISDNDFSCHTVGLGSNAVGFGIANSVNPPGAEWVFNLFSDNNCRTSLGTQLGPFTCFSGSVGSFTPQTVPT